MSRPPGITTFARLVVCMLLIVLVPGEGEWPERGRRQASIVECDEFKSVDREVIWSGRVGAFCFGWTERDFLVSTNGVVRSLFRSISESDFRTIEESYLEDRGEEAFECTYSRHFQVQSVVGALIGFLDSRAVFCGRSYPFGSTRFATVDVSATLGRDGIAPDYPGAPEIGRIVSLTDLYDEEEVVRALARILNVQGPTPTNLARLLEVVGEVEADSQEYSLTPDLFTRFVIADLEADQLIAVLSLPGAHVANRFAHHELRLALPVPQKLSDPLLSIGASSVPRREFESMAGDRGTTLTYRYGSRRTLGRPGF